MMKAFIKRIMVCLYRILNFILPKNSRLVVFSTDNGKAAGGNPRAIYNYAVHDIRKNGLKYKLVWFLTDELIREHPEEAVKLMNVAGGRKPHKGNEACDDQGGKNEESLRKTGNPIRKTGNSVRINWNGSTCKVVRYGHPAYYWYMARAGVWIFDSRQEPYIIKRPGVRYLQTWHGTPLKKLGLDIDELNMAGENRAIEAYKEAVRRESAQWDHLIAQNDFSAETFRRCFDFKGAILKIGYPRNDILVRAARQEAAGNENNVKQPDNNSKENGQHRKTLLYAPTWRDDKYLEGGWYAYSSPLDLKKLYELLGDEYRIIIKPHYLVKIRENDIPAEMIENRFVKICGQSEEINDLYKKADGLITDYSSAMFDYSLLGRPMFFFAYDIEEYSKVLRGFYFDFEAEAPGPIARTTEELADAVKAAFETNDGWEKYGARVSRFVQKYNTYDDGEASRRAWLAAAQQR